MFPPPRPTPPGPTPPRHCLVANMKQIALSCCAVVLVLGAIAFSQSARKAGDEIQIDKEGRNPWTNLRWNNDADTFHFAVVSDRTGGHRARVFSQAVEQLNLLQPAFVVSVGDLIEGYTKDKQALNDQWKEFQGYVNKLQMPFFYVAGNHDLANAVEVNEWKERFGRRYYHFLYREVLFLAACTDDEGEDHGEGKNAGAISKEQVAYFQNVLKRNPSVRWTVVMVHKPVWSMEKAKSEGWLEIEKSLEGRKYTVFAGHVHRFQKYVRNGMNYYQLATTGGGSKMRGLAYNEVDHISWITMKSDGPTVAHVLLDGVLPENMRPVVSAEEGMTVYNRKPVHPVKGLVLCDGTPVPGAKIVLNQLDAKDTKVSPIADGYTEGDGRFVLSTYKAWDGAPVGEYVVTVVHREKYYDDLGQPGVNRLPSRYASAKTSDLKASIKIGPNELTLELAP